MMDLAHSSLQPQTPYQTLVDGLARTIITDYSKHAPTHRYLVSVSGPPGSGKTTIACDIVERINTIFQLQIGSVVATNLPMDGFHFTRAELDKMPDPVEAHERRGAPFTFDVKKIKVLLERLRRSVVDKGEKKAEVVKAPSFDHALKDPVADDILILPTQRIVIVEGNYLSMTEFPIQSDEAMSIAEGKEPQKYPQEKEWTTPMPEWKDVAASFHKSIFLNTPRELCLERLARRHLEAGICSTVEEANARASGSDARNGDDILRWKGKVDIEIEGNDYKFANHLKQDENVAM